MCLSRFLTWQICLLKKSRKFETLQYFGISWSFYLLQLHAGGLDFRLYDGSDLKPYLLMRWFGPDALAVFLYCVCFVFVHVCLYVLWGHLLGKGWPLGSHLWCLTVSLSLSHWYPGSGVVFDCIISWSVHPYLLLWSPSYLLGFK